jgi:hypothetical protein
MLPSMKFFLDSLMIRSSSSQPPAPPCPADSRTPPAHHDHLIAAVPTREHHESQSDQTPPLRVATILQQLGTRTSSCVLSSSPRSECFNTDVSTPAGADLSTEVQALLRRVDRLPYRTASEMYEKFCAIEDSAAVLLPPETNLEPVRIALNELAASASSNSTHLSLTLLQLLFDTETLASIAAMRDDQRTIDLASYFRVDPHLLDCAPEPQIVVEHTLERIHQASRDGATAWTSDQAITAQKHLAKALHNLEHLLRSGVLNGAVDAMTPALDVLTHHYVVELMPDAVSRAELLHAVLPNVPLAILTDPRNIDFPFRNACRSGNLMAAHALLERGAAIAQTVNRNGDTALMAAVYTEDIALVQKVIDHGGLIHLNCPDAYGLTPLGAASLNDNMEMLGLLKRYGARY